MAVLFTQAIIHSQVGFDHRKMNLIRSVPSTVFTSQVCGSRNLSARLTQQEIGKSIDPVRGSHQHFSPISATDSNIESSQPSKPVDLLITSLKLETRHYTHHTQPVKSLSCHINDQDHFSCSSVSVRHDNHDFHLLLGLVAE